MTNQCNFSACSELISPIHVYCVDHFELFSIGGIDNCPVCKDGKFVNSPLCVNCRQTVDETVLNERIKFAAIQFLSEIDKLVLSTSNTKISEPENPVRDLIDEMIRSADKFRAELMN